MADAAGDRLSSLPDEILHHVLSLLPSIDEAARTSILAGRWRHLWSSNPVLHFSFSVQFLVSVNNALLVQRIVSVVDECLIRASSPGLVSLQLPLLPTPIFPSVLSRWLRFAENHHAAEIVLLPVFNHQEIAIPPVIFDCRHLCSLKVDNCAFPGIPPRILTDGRPCFDALRTLFMFKVAFAGNSFGALLNLCPNIERLALSSCKVSDGITILSSTLRFLAVYQWGGHDTRVEIVSAPRLQHLVYSGTTEDLLLPEGVSPELEEATILFTSTSSKPFQDEYSWRRFVSSIAHVKRLTADSWFHQFARPGEPMFENLTELHWWPVFTGASILALFSALTGCPLIEKLCLHVFPECYQAESFEGWIYTEAVTDFEKCEITDGDDRYEITHWWMHPLKQFEHVGYALMHLKTIKVIGCSGDMRLEQRLLEFVLQKSVNLRSVIIYYVAGDKELRRMLQALDFSPKASADVCISTSELTEEPCSKSKFITFMGISSLYF